MRCPVRSRSGSPFRFEPRAAPAAIAPVRRYAASAPSRPRAAPAWPQATLHVFRSCDWSLFLSFLLLQQVGEVCAADDGCHRWRESGNRRGRDDDQESKSDDGQPQRHIDRSFRGQELLGEDEAAIPAIQLKLMTLRATSISISPMLEPTQQSPNSNPEPTLPPHRRRKCCLSGVSSYAPAAITSAPAAKDPCGRYNAYTATPTSVQTARYDPTNSGTVRAPRA